jgi:transcriptional regulator with XRE-family HTH domain
VAARLGMTAGNYAHYEKGRNRLTFVDVPRFAEALGVDTVRLIERLGIELPQSPPTRALSPAIHRAEEDAAINELLGDPEFLYLAGDIARGMRAGDLNDNQRRFILSNLRAIRQYLYEDDAMTLPGAPATVPAHKWSE